MRAWCFLKDLKRACCVIVLHCALVRITSRSRHSTEIKRKTSVDIHSSPIYLICISQCWVSYSKKVKTIKRMSLKYKCLFNVFHILINIKCFEMVNYPHDMQVCQVSRKNLFCLYFVYFVNL